MSSGSDGYAVIFVRHFRHWKTKKIIRRKDGGVIALKIKRKN